MAAASSTETLSFVSTRNELLDAQRRGTVLETTTKGFKGRVIEVRENDVVLEQVLDKGANAKARLYIRFDNVKLPVRFTAGARVQTPYGRGVVRELRSTPERVDYVVDLLDNKLSMPTTAQPQPASASAGTSGGAAATATPSSSTDGAAAASSASPYSPHGCAIGYLSPEQLSLRASSAMEVIADADVIREAGNKHFLASDFDAAIVAYDRAMKTLSTLRIKPEGTERRVFTDCFLKCLGNTAQCYLRRSPPDYRQVIQYVDESLTIDPSDECGNNGKMYLRRAEAHLALGDHTAALSDLRRKECMKLKGQKVLFDKAQAAKEEYDKEQKRMWQGAVKKAKEEDEKKAANASASGAASGKGATPLAGAGNKEGKRVTFASPEQGTPSSGSAGAGASTPDRSADGTSRQLFAGSTPHPAKAKRAIDELNGTGNDDDEDSSGSNASSSSGSSVLPYVLGGLAVVGVAAAAWYFGPKIFSGSAGASTASSSASSASRAVPAAVKGAAARR